MTAPEQATSTIALMLVEDHGIVRQGLRLLLDREPDLRVVAEACGIGDALTSQADPDVIVADLVLGDAQGPRVVDALRERFPNAAILVLTMVDRLEDVERSLAAGARGYLLKESAAEDLVEAVRRVRAGESYVQPSLGAALAHRRRRPLDLSPRETEVLRLVALGHTTAEISKMLQLAARTVESHRARIHQKLGLRTRAELVRYAVGAGLVNLAAPE